MTTKEIEFVIAHEILHCVFDHMTGREDRDPQLHNIACDYIVNNTLCRDNIGEKPKDIQFSKIGNMMVGLQKQCMMTSIKKVKKKWSN